jgi:TRAP-type transport system small permease protein
MPVWVVFLEASLGVKERRHFYVNFLPDNLPPAVETAVNLIYYALMYLIALIFTGYGYRFFMGGAGQHSQIIGFNLGWIYVTVPLAGVSWLLFLTENLITDFFRKEA